jgi:hypothetical protein
MPHFAIKEGILRLVWFWAHHIAFNSGILNLKLKTKWNIMGPMDANGGLGCTGDVIYHRCQTSGKCQGYFRL